MNLEIITPEKKLYNGKIVSVKVPGKKGSFAVLRNHAPLISSLDKGTIKIIAENNEVINYDIHGGVIEVNKNKIIILADM